MQMPNAKASKILLCLELLELILGHEDTYEQKYAGLLLKMVNSMQNAGKVLLIILNI